MIKKLGLILCLVLLSSTMVMGSVVVANTGTTLPKGTFSVTGGGVTVLVDGFDADNINLFLIGGYGLGNKLDLSLEYIHDDFLGLDVERSLYYKNRLAISAALGLNYRLQSELVGASLNLLLSKGFGGLEPYVSLEGNVIFDNNNSTSLTAVLGIDIKITKPLSVVFEIGLPLSEDPMNPSVLLGLCWYLGDRI